MMPGWLFSFQRFALLLTATLFSAGYAPVGLVLIFFAVIAETIITRRIPWQHSPIDPALFPFIVIISISAVASSYHKIALGSTLLAILTIYLTFGTLYRFLRKEPEFLRHFLWAWTMGGIASAVLAVSLHHVTGQPAFTPALGKNAVGTTTLIALLFAQGLFLTETPILKYLTAAGFSILSLAAVLSYSRGSWIGMASGFIIFFLLVDFRYSWRALLLILAIVTAGIVFTASEPTTVMTKLISISNEANLRGRIAVARAALAIFRDHPIIGTGLNTFSVVYPAYRLPGGPKDEPFAYNVFLDMAAEGGVLGAIGFTATIFAALSIGWHWYFKSRSRKATIISATVLSALLGVLVSQLFDETMMSVHLGAGFWFLMAMLVALPPESGMEKSPTSSSDVPQSP